MTWPFQPLLPAAQQQSSPPPSLAPDDDSFLGGIARNLVAVPLAIAAVALSANVALAAQLNQHQDEVVPWLPGEALPSTFAQRAQQAPQFARWFQTDDLPAPVSATLDEEGWQPAVAPAAKLSAQTWQGDEEIAPTPVTLVDDDAGWQPPRPTPFAVLVQAWYEQDEVFRPQIDDDAWWRPAFVAPAQVPAAWQVDDEIVPQPPAGLATDDDPWQRPIVVAFALPPQPFTADDEIVPPGVDRPADTAGPFAQRAQHGATIVRWWQTDELPIAATPLGLDEEPWAAPFSIAQRLTLPDPGWHSDEIGTPATPLAADDSHWHLVVFAGDTSFVALWGDGNDLAPHLDEDYHWTAPVVRAGIARQPFTANDEIATAATPGRYEDDSWLSLRNYQPAPARQAFQADDEVVPAATPLGLDEEGWTAPAPVQPRAVAALTWLDDDLPATAPPPFVDDDAGWLSLSTWLPLRNTQPAPVFAPSEDWAPLALEVDAWQAPYVVPVPLALTGPLFDDALPVRLVLPEEFYHWQAFSIEAPRWTKVFADDQLIVAQPLLTTAVGAWRVEWERRVLDIQPELRVFNVDLELRVVNALFTTRPYGRPENDA